MAGGTTQTVTSHGGLALPKIGLGTYTLNGFAGAEAIEAAIDMGYCLIDSACNYENEGAAGAAIRASSVPRDRGLVKWIGVSNFLPEHIERLEAETGVVPEVNQIQCHPYFPDSTQVAYDRSKGIITEAWSPLGRARTLLEEPAIVDIAAGHNATPAQVVLAWHMSRGVVPIPKSSSLERLASNLKSVNLDLSEPEVAAITALGEGPEGEGRSPRAGRVLDLDPATHEEF